MEHIGKRVTEWKSRIVNAVDQTAGEAVYEELENEYLILGELVTLCTARNLSFRSPKMPLSEAAEAALTTRSML